jgi:hypothetical protein
VSESFPHYFNPETLGESLKEVAVEVYQSSRHDVVSRWFHSAKDADLFIWLDEKHGIIKQQLSYYGQVVEWNVIEGVKTGNVIVEQGEFDQNGNRARGTKGAKGSEILRFDEKPQQPAIQQALKLLEHVTALSETERVEISENFRKIGTSQTMPPEEFIARFAEFVEQRPGPISPSQSPSEHTAQSRWKRLLNQISRWFKS